MADGIYVDVSVGSKFSPMEDLPGDLSSNWRDPLLPFDSLNTEGSVGPCFLLKLPLEVRRTIYRYIAVSRLDCHSHPRLWRPLGVDGSIHRIGYFDRDTVIPLMQTSHQIHDEVASVLYGENTFSFHISGLAEGPIRFFEWCPPRYIRLLRKVYIRTGYNVDTYGFRSQSRFMENSPIEQQSPAQKQIRTARDLAMSVKLMKQAWPAKYKVLINSRATVAYPADELLEILRQQSAINWPASGFHLWKMFVTEVDADLPRIEFKRIEWGGPTVKNLRPDGTREVIPE